jgi:hypothetical protein
MRIRSEARHLSFALLVLVLAVASESRAEPRFGVRGGVNLDVDGPYVGADLLAPLGPSWWIDPNVEYASGDRLDVLSFSADVIYGVDVSGSTDVWVGGGMAVLARDHESRRIDDETDAGVNALFGVGWPSRGGVMPYVQARATFADDAQGELGLGVRF